MEFSILYPLLISVFSGVVCLFYFWYHNPIKGKQNKLPPGNIGWPIIGETLNFLKGDPEKFITGRMKKYSPDVFTTSVGGEKMAVLCGPAGNKLIFSNENKLVVSWWPPTIVKIINGSEIIKSKTTRSIIVEFLKTDSLKKYAPIIDWSMRPQFEAEWKRGQTEVKAWDFCTMLNFKLACWMFASIDDPEHVQRLHGLFLEVSTGFLSIPFNFPGTAYNRAIKAANLIKKDLLDIIKQRKANNLHHQEDLLSHTMGSMGEDGKLLTDQDVANIILSLIIASLDTTSSVMVSVLYFLADHHGVYAQVFQEQTEVAKTKGEEEFLSWEDISKMKYSRYVMNEAMRLMPPAQVGFKRVLCDFRHGDFVIPRGWKALWSVYSTHKDPKYFKNPEEFNPSRFEGDGPLPFTFVPFGGGPRMCPGNEFSRLMVLTFMHHLVTKFKWEKVFPNEKIIYTPLPRPEKGLPIRLLPRTF